MDEHAGPQRTNRKQIWDGLLGDELDERDFWGVSHGREKALGDFASISK
jgi:hypothetical protein